MLRPTTTLRPLLRTSHRYIQSSVTPTITTPNTPNTPNASATNATPVHNLPSSTLQETVAEGEALRKQQAPNRAATWSKSQRPRELAMVGPRFEQTIFEQQPRPYAAIELVHQQKVRWSEQRVVGCDGGGGPMGHPRVFINVDKPEVVPCGYCGLPFAHASHKKTLMETGAPYPLE